MMRRGAILEAAKRDIQAMVTGGLVLGGLCLLYTSDAADE